MTALYDLTAGYAALLAADEPDEFEAALADLGDAIEAKVDGLGRVIRMLEADHEMYKAEAARLAERARAAENRAAGLKAYLKANLETIGQDKVKGAGLLFGARLQANSSPSVTIADPAAVPLEYQRVIPARMEPDIAAIVEAWKRGGSVPGAEVQRGRHVRIF